MYSTVCGDLMCKCCVVVCIQSCVYEIPRLLSLLVLACIASKDGRLGVLVFGCVYRALDGLDDNG